MRLPFRAVVSSALLFLVVSVSVLAVEAGALGAVMDTNIRLGGEDALSL